MRSHRSTQRRLLALLVFACAPAVACSNGDTWTPPPVTGDENAVSESGGSSGSDSTTPAPDAGSNTDDGSGADSTIGDDSSSSDGGSIQDDGAAADGAGLDDTGTLPDTAVADDTGATDTGSAGDGADDAVADSEGPDVSNSDASDAGSDASDASDASLDASEAASDAQEAGVDASDAGPVDAGVDAAKCNANVLVPNAAVASPMALKPASNAIDGDFTTRWESIHGVDPQWIYLDYGAPVYVSRVQIAWETACAKNYDLQVSNDLTTWTTMTSIAGNTNGGPAPTNWTTAANHPVLSGVGRYLRVNGTVRCTGFGYSMWEMRAFGDTNATCTP